MAASLIIISCIGQLCEENLILTFHNCGISETGGPLTSQVKDLVPKLWLWERRIKNNCLQIIPPTLITDGLEESEVSLH